MESNAAFLQETTALPREGLPYWIFWLLLCIILLLLTFIFLRDKDLRQRLSSFLSGAKRKFKKLRLQAKLSREKRTKIDLLKKLGKKAWEEDIRTERGEKICSELKSLDEKKNLYQGEKEEIVSQMDMVNKKYQENRASLLAQIKAEESGKKPYKAKMAEIKKKDELAEEREETQKKIDEYGERIKELRGEEKSLSREHKREIREWLKKKGHVEEKILQIERLTEPLFEFLGRVIDDQRIDHNELKGFYSQIDRTNRNIQDLIGELDKT